MQKYILILVISCSFAASSMAQTNYEMRQALDFFRSNKLVSGDWKNSLTESDIEGSPYLNDEFVDGTVFTVQKQQFVDVPLRYNIFNDQMEFKTQDGEVQAIATPEIVEKVNIGDIQMVYLPYSISKKIRKGFFTVIEEGKASLYLKHEIFFQKAVEPAAYKDAEPAKFEKRPDEFFIRVGSAEAQLIDNKKDLLDAFPDKQNEIEKFVKQNKIKTNNSENLLEVIRYYNSL